MITTYFDKGCAVLRSSQSLALSDGCSALWFCTEKKGDLSHFLRFVSSTFCSLSGFFWLAQSGGAESPRMLDLKRSFGRWGVPKSDLVSKNEFWGANQEKNYSDIVCIRDGNIDALGRILNRNLFGVDSSIFFLPPGRGRALNNITRPLVDLLVKRNAMKVIDESLRNQGLLENFIFEVLSLSGVAFVSMRDSNMGTLMAAVGDEANLNEFLMDMQEGFKGDGWRHVVDDAEFDHILMLGVSISVFG